jgi:hypothetical protein
LGTLLLTAYGDRPVKVYPVRESELNDLKRWAWLSLATLGLAAPILILAVIQMVNSVKRETSFENQDETQEPQ